MPAKNDSLKKRLSGYREITISVTGRKSGRIISHPVWFVLEDNTLHLLPVQGSKTQWYQNVLKNPKIKIEAQDAKDEVQAAPTTDPAQVLSVVEKFRKKYGPGEVKQYYSNFDAAVLVSL